MSKDSRYYARRYYDIDTTPCCFIWEILSSRIMMKLTQHDQGSTIAEDGS